MLMTAMSSAVPWNPIEEKNKLAKAQMPAAYSPETSQDDIENPLDAPGPNATGGQQTHVFARQKTKKLHLYEGGEPEYDDEYDVEYDEEEEYYGDEYDDEEYGEEELYYDEEVEYGEEAEEEVEETVYDAEEKTRAEVQKWVPPPKRELLFDDKERQERAERHVNKEIELLEKAKKRWPRSRTLFYGLRFDWSSQLFTMHIVHFLVRRVILASFLCFGAHLAYWGLHVMIFSCMLMVW